MATKGGKAKVPEFMKGPSGKQIRRQNTKVKQKPQRSNITSRRGS
ncbi:MAG: hypothetical protein WCX85_01135 [Bacilli bacterium]|jgi:hypothetical protein|nr:hypothetical protein [Bacilli bacterium]